MNREEVPELKRNPCRRVFEWHEPGEKLPSTALWSSGHQRVAARPFTYEKKIYPYPPTENLGLKTAIGNEIIFNSEIQFRHSKDDNLLLRLR
ncbi:hypothetical protein TNCV_2079091 [Trichonephila clavipes]|nr:hypothetical protein TNCV_2079091 [Trichonephila clavipes]